MSLTKDEIHSCVYCIKDAKGQPPCLANNNLAREKNHPLLRVVTAGDRNGVKWPCYFHADWREIAPSLAGQRPSGDGTVHDSDLAMTAYRDAASQQWLATLKRDTVAYAETYGASSHHSPNRVEAARSEACARAVGYVTNGQKTLYSGFYTLLYASHRTNRFQNWTEALAKYNDCAGMLVSFTHSKWGFNTYGGGGAFDISLGDVLVNSPQGATVTLAYAGIGAGLSTPKFKKIPKSIGSGGPNRFTTSGIVYQNMEVFGSAEPKTDDFNGFCLFFNASVAAGAGFGDEGASVGFGRDATYILINPLRPRILIMMQGNTAGWNAGAGIYLGYIYVAG